MGLKIKFCRLADKDHKRSKRQYAHTYHYPWTICFAKAAKNLKPREFAAIFAHEIGHLLAGPGDGLPHAAVERAANRAANEYFGTKIRYRDSGRGRRVQVLSRSDFLKIRRKMMQLLRP